MLKRRPTLKTPWDLAEAGFVSPETAESLMPVAERYSIAMTPALADLVDPSDPDDPIARQFVPSVDELLTTPDEHADPIGDERHTPVRGIVNRYPDRVLLKLTHICPVYCRFCFRREMVGAANGPGLSSSELEAALAYIESHSDIWEVILTGGDPLALSPRQIAKAVTRLNAIPHVKILRWHTRVPVAKPEMITGELIAAMNAPDKTTYVVLHTNHARELSPQARTACWALIRAGFPMLSQSVLLKGVNNSIHALEALMRALIESGIKPYYLHHADLAPGTSHFRTSIAEGQSLMRELQARASGLCLPTYVLDIPGGYAKARLELCDAEIISGGDSEGSTTYRIRDAEGARHIYSAEE
jgi:lysine 2,3-aminomutase